MRRRWVVVLAVLVVLDVLVLVVGYRAHQGTLPPFQRSATSFPVSSSPTDGATSTPGGDAAAEITAPVLLSVNNDGVVLRATMGACEAQFGGPAHLWTGKVVDDAPLTLVEAPGITEVLGLIVYPKGSMRVAGLDDHCDPLTLDSDDSGATWQQVDDSQGSGIWEMPADTTATSVTSPAGHPVKIGCLPGQILNLADTQAIASCPEGGGFYDLAAGEQPSSNSANGYTDLSVAPGRRQGEYVVFGSTDTCTAQVAVINVANSQTDVKDCHGASRAPLAIATTPDLVIVQVGNDLMSSSDGGTTFTSVGPEPTESVSPSATASSSTSAS